MTDNKEGASRFPLEIKYLNELESDLKEIINDIVLLSIKMNSLEPKIRRLFKHPVSMAANDWPIFLPFPTHVMASRDRELWGKVCDWSIDLNLELNEEFQDLDAMKEMLEDWLKELKELLVVLTRKDSDISERLK